MMRRYNVLRTTAVFATGLISAMVPLQGQKPETTFTSQSRLVLVDAVVTDKKGTYIHDLTQKDFRIWEDNKEQPVKTFSYEADPAAAVRQHYLVLFFDNTTMDFAQRNAARQAAAKFVQASAGPNQLMAVVNFGGSLQVTQNFTANADRLMKVVTSDKAANVVASAEIASAAGFALTAAELDFGSSSVLMGLRSLAKNLASVPGRKTVVLLTGGFQIPQEKWSELEAAIAQCNKANVAIYPLDARGLVGGTTRLMEPAAPNRHAAPAGFAAAVYHPGAATLVNAAFQRPAGGGQTGGGAPPSGGTGGGRVGGGGARNIGGSNNLPPMTQPHTPGGVLIAPTPLRPTDNQAVLQELAQGTGGFVIANTNDLVSGLQRIGQEQNQYYILGFAPAPSKEGSCHTLRVKVDRGGTEVRSRTGYCNLKPVDLLAGSPAEKELEARVDAAPAATGGTRMSLPFFYTAPNTARVNLSMELPTSALKFEKEKGKQHASVNVLGIAYKADGSVAARFSDTVDLELDNKQVEELARKPYRYNKQFLIASGDYTLKVVFSSDAAVFGNAQGHLKVDRFEDGQFSLSSLALSTESIDLVKDPARLSEALLDDRLPLVYDSMEIVPSISNRFKKSDPPVLYAEIYQPTVLSGDPPTLMVQYQVLDRATGAVKLDTGIFKPNISAKSGSPVVPVGLRIRSDKLEPGAYRLVFRASDSAGHNAPERSTDFDVE